MLFFSLIPEYIKIIILQIIQDEAGVKKKKKATVISMSRHTDTFFFV